MLKIYANFRGTSGSGPSYSNKNCCYLHNDSGLFVPDTRLSFARGSLNLLIAGTVLDEV